MSTLDDATLIITRLFDAPVQCVFDAWMSREEWQSWIGPEGVDCDVLQLEPRVGGRYRLEMRPGVHERIVVSGTFLAIEEPTLLRFTWGADGDPTRQTVITLTFTARGDKTEMTLRHEGLGDQANRDSHRRGWSSAFNKLDRYLTSEERQ
jgi:uncharacterized protein YndB with AHSA1/START domain